MFCFFQFLSLFQDYFHDAKKIYDLDIFKFHEFNLLYIQLYKKSVLCMYVCMYVCVNSVLLSLFLKRMITVSGKLYANIRA